MTEIKHHNDEKKGLFEIYFENKKAGEMTYTWAGDDKFIIDHTQVDEAFSGKGLAKKLVVAGVEYAVGLRDTQSIRHWPGRPANSRSLWP